MHSLKAQPWAQELSKKRKEELGGENMSVLWLPFGPRADFAPDKIVQTPGLLNDALCGSHLPAGFPGWRPLPRDPNPT
jgi:hypothetical protein